MHPACAELLLMSNEQLCFLGELCCDYAQELLEGILSMAPRSSSAGSACREVAVSELATHVQSLLPEAFDVEEIQEKYPTRYEESMNTVIVQESIRLVRFSTSPRIIAFRRQLAYTSLLPAGKAAAERRAARTRHKRQARMQLRWEPAHAP